MEYGGVRRMAQVSYVTFTRQIWIINMYMSKCAISITLTRDVGVLVCGTLTIFIHIEGPLCRIHF